MFVLFLSLFIYLFIYYFFVIECVLYIFLLFTGTCTGTEVLVLHVAIVLA